MKPANILITFEGVLKIADFGLATPWPAAPGIEGEGDREYIGPEILMGQFDKPADIFALGLIMLEIAGNVMLPDNGASWQRLRSGDMTDVPSLTSSSDVSSISRDPSGNPVSPVSSFDELYSLYVSSWDEGDEGKAASAAASKSGFAHDLNRSGDLVKKTPDLPASELHAPPRFMIDPNHEEAIDKLVRWMISPLPADRPMVRDLLLTGGVQFVSSRRRAGATVYEGNWGPADEVLQDDAEMIDV